MVRKIIILIFFFSAVVFAGLFYLQSTISYLNFDDAYDYLYRFTGIASGHVLSASGWGTVRVFSADPYKKVKYTLTWDGWEEFKRSSKLMERSGFQKTKYTLDPSIFSSEKEIIFNPMDKNISYYFSKNFGRQVFCIKRNDEVDVYLY